MDVFIFSKDILWNIIENPGIFFSKISSKASGVTSVSVKPVPPVVIITLILSLLDHLVIISLIESLLSVIIFLSNNS